MRSARAQADAQARIAANFRWATTRRSEQFHVPPKAKRVIQLFMAGAASHIDLFDYKPRARKISRPSIELWRACRGFSKRPWPVDEIAVLRFSNMANAASILSEAVAPLGACVDELAFVHNMVGKTGVHSQATYLQATGFQTPGFPGHGLLDQLRPRQHERESADVRGAARSSRLCLEWSEELARRVSAQQHQGTMVAAWATNPIEDLFATDTKFITRESERATTELLTD